jgi:tetratricopeptide (TPR) repeat protein
MKPLIKWPRLVRAVALALAFSGEWPAYAATASELYDHAIQLEHDGFFDEAVQTWTQVLSATDLEPGRRSVAQIKLSMDHFKLQQFDQALEVSQKAAQAEPQNYDAQFHLANLLASLKRYPEAIAVYQKTIGLRKEEGLAHVGLALSHFGNHDSDTATKILYAVKELFRTQKNISWHRDSQLMIAQIQHFAHFPPDFANLWLEKNIKMMRETFEQKVFKQ